MKSVFRGVKRVKGLSSLILSSLENRWVFIYRNPLRQIVQTAITLAHPQFLQIHGST